MCYLPAFDQPTRQLTIAVNVKTGMKAALAIPSLMFSCLKYLKSSCVFMVKGPA